MSVAKRSKTGEPAGPTGAIVPITFKNQNVREGSTPFTTKPGAVQRFEAVYQEMLLAQKESFEATYQDKLLAQKKSFEAVQRFEAVYQEILLAQKKSFEATYQDNSWQKASL